MHRSHFLSSLLFFNVGIVSRANQVAWKWTNRTTSNLPNFLQLAGESSTYKTYVKLQQSKLRQLPDKIERIDRCRQAQVADELSHITTSRAAGISSFAGTTVLCLGARLGGEVRAFKSHGATALGIDLNPGEGNMDVVAG